MLYLYYHDNKSTMKRDQMEKRFTIGLGIIHAEEGEVRAFLPEFVGKISRFFEEVLLEKGYGTSLGIEPDSYTKFKNVRFGSSEETYSQNYVLVLRYPREEFLNLMHPGGCLISMCHFPTRPKRHQFLKDNGIVAISLDSITDDNGQRLVENLSSVAWNGCEVAFELMDKICPSPGLENPNRTPIYVTILGSGGVGIHAVQASIRYGNPELWQNYASKNIPGNIVQVIDYDLTPHHDEVRALLNHTELLIDATQRKSPTEIIIPNHLLKEMPDHAVLLDLSVDPYNFGKKPFNVKGIEGIPQGDLDQYIFSPNDPAWEDLPDQIDTTNRRWVVSCYSWPGIHPRPCMLRYGNQLSPLLRRLVNAGGIEGINPRRRSHDRALSRGMLKHWE